jgi:hypothetical protein
MNDPVGGSEDSSHAENNFRQSLLYRELFGPIPVGLIPKSTRRKRDS